jgi:hypothetical protein
MLNEAFPTARSWGISIGVLALAMAVGRRFWLGLVLAITSCAIHPLLGVWPLLVIIATYTSDRWLIAGGLLALTAVLFVNALGVSQFQSMDADWRSIIRHSSIDIFVGPPGIARINETIAWISVLLWAGQLSNERVGRWYQLGALFAASGFFVAQVNSYVLTLLILVQAQLWRAMWIAVFLGTFAIALLLGRAWKSPHRLWWIVLGGLMMACYSIAGYVLFIAFLVWNSKWRAHIEEAGRALDRLLSRFVPILIGAFVILMLPGYLVQLEILAGGVAPIFSLGISWLDGLMLAGGLGLGLVLLSILLGAGQSNKVIAVASMVAFFVVATKWDVRHEIYRNWEVHPRSALTLSLRQFIQPGDVALWLGENPQRVWYELGTANYASSDQLIGGVFSREKTFELLHRRQRLAVAEVAVTWPLTAADEVGLLSQYRLQTGDALDVRANLHQSYKRPILITPSGLLYLCEDTNLDWVVANVPLAQPVLSPTTIGVGPQAWLYSCKELRAMRQGDKLHKFVLS